MTFFYEIETVSDLPNRCCATTDSAIFKVAESKEERAKAFRLVYQVYRESNLISKNQHRMHVTPHQLLPSTKIFVALDEDKSILYTISLVLDGAAGVPIESLYAKHVEEMRLRKLSLAELSCLAGPSKSRSTQHRGTSQLNVCIGLISIAAQCAKKQSVDRLLVAVHPRHVRFYKDFLGFEVFGGVKSYARVNHNPAVGCFHDIEANDACGFRLHNRVYRHKCRDCNSAPQPMTTAEREYFAKAIDAEE